MTEVMEARVADSAGSAESAEDTGNAGVAPPQANSAAARTHASTFRLLRAELRWIFRRPRTMAVLGLIGIIPILVGVAITLIDAPGPPGGDSTGSMMTGFGANALMLPIGSLMTALALLLPLAAAMSGADAIAGEQSHGTLRGWLLAPVGRGRLLLVKAFGVAVFALAATSLMALTAVLTGLVINGTGALVTLSGTTVSLPVALGKVALAVGWVTVQLLAVGAVALAISSVTEHPMVVVVSMLSGLIVFNVLGLFDALSWLHPYLITESWQSLVDVLRDPVPPDALSEGALRAAAYLVIGLSLAYARVTTKDG